MQRPAQRLALLVLGLIAFIILTSLLYQLGMARLEGKPRTFWEAFEWAGESLSITGYGADAKWSHPLMVLFVVAVQFVGAFLLFLIIPIYLVPDSRRALRRESATRAGWEARRSCHRLPLRPRGRDAAATLRSNDVATLVVEIDEAPARAVMESGQPVVFSRAEEDVLTVCRLEHAKAIVANGRDQENAALILRARQMGFRGEIYAFVEDPSHRKPMELSGATSVYTPRHIIAAALAAHANDRINARLPGLEQIDGLVRRELRVTPSSALAGRTIRDARLPAVVVGVWNRSRLQTRVSDDTVIEPNSVLELVGIAESLASLELLRNSGPYLVVGFGEVGRKVHELLTDAGEEVRVIERAPGTNVDVVGDVLDSSVLERAGIAGARALVLALDSDDSTLFATVIARDLAPDVPIIARVNHARNVDSIHRAGADFALSISDVSGEMLSTRLLGRQARVREEHRRILRVDGAWCVADGEGREIVRL